MGGGGGGSLPPVLTSLLSVPINSSLDMLALSHEPLGWQLLPLPVAVCLMWLSCGSMDRSEASCIRTKVLYLVFTRTHADEDLGASSFLRPFA